MINSKRRWQLPQKLVSLAAHWRRKSNLSNGSDRAEFWRSFIKDRCAYPAPERLQAQLAVAEFHSFCNCGCNSFAVSISESSDIPPLAAPSKGGQSPLFYANFLTAAGKHLEIILFVNGAGHLDYVDITINANSEPVPEDPQLNDLPYHTYTEISLLA